MRRHRHNLKPAQFDRLNLYPALHPVPALVCRPEQHLCYLLIKEYRTHEQFRSFIARLFKVIYLLCGASPAHPVTLGGTLHTRHEEIATMRRFTSSNGIAGGFSTKMEYSAASLRLPQLQKLQNEGSGIVLLRESEAELPPL